MSEGMWIALIMAGLGMMGSVVNGYFIYKANQAKKSGNNPHPCAKHEAILEKFDMRLDEIDRTLVKSEQQRTELYRRLDRLENKWNGRT